MQLKNSKKSKMNGTMDKLPTTTTTTSLNCSHQLQQIQQIQQQHQQQQQRCSSVGSTGSSTCDTLSSHSGSALSPTLPIANNGYLSKTSPTNATTLAATLSGEKMPVSALSTLPLPLPLRGMASRMSLNASPSESIYPLGTASTTTLSTLPLVPALPPPPPPPLHPSLAPVSAPATPSAGASTTLNVGNIGVSAAAAMAAANLAESFTLLQQQAAHHFQDILYAAHLLGRGYYQPAGPLISPHVLPPVATGPPPTLTNVSLLPATTAATAGGASSKKQQQIPTPLSSDPEHLHPAPPSTTSAADSTDSDVLITGGDLTPFRYPASSATGTVPSHHQTSQQQQQQQQQHQLHQQAAAAAAAHQGTPYPRSMHAAQMHYLTAYPPNYYAPYPGEAMCYSPPTAAYQPYFPTKVYQSGPPHPPPGAYRRYNYYQPGPPPPSELYEPAPPPPTNSNNTGGQQSGPPPTQGPSQAPPPQSGTGSQLVPAGPAAHAQHLEHYPGPPGYYSGYSPGGAAAGQCYTRTIQGPYMEYPPQCPCPMQQSCPKNVHTGPHIGSKNGNPNSHNSNTPIISSNSGSNMTAMSHNSSNLIVNGCQSSSNSNNNGKSTNSTSNNTSNTPMNANNNNNNSTMNTATTNRGPVKNVTSQHLRQQQQQQQQHQQQQQQQQQSEMNKFVNSYHQRDLLKTPVKSELKTEDSDCKSQYEEHVVQPPTPPESYGTNDDKSLLIDDDVMEEAMEKLEMSRLTVTAETVPTSATMTATSSPEIVPTNIEAYDLTTTITPPLMSIAASACNNAGNNNSHILNGGTPHTQQSVVGRKARIGKTMAREMVYAAAATAATAAPVQQHQYQHQQQHQQQQQQQQQQQTQPLIQVRNLPQQNGTISVESAPATVATLTTTSSTMATSLPLLATIKTEIKAEHIKTEDDLMDTILRQQHISSTSICNNHNHNELKIKAEPLSSLEAEMTSPHTAVFDILSRLHPNQEERDGNAGQQFHQEPCSFVDSSASAIAMPKPINEGRMRLAANWQRSSKTNGEIDLSIVSDDDVLDLRHSPMPGDNSGKRIKILDFHNTPGACKKSSPNSYKNLIKQAEPKAYLCLSRRRIDKRNRYSIIQRKSMTNGGVNVRRRHVVLTEQQKERLKLRRKKLIALERKRQEAFERKRTAFRKRRLEAKQAEQAGQARAQENQLKTEKLDQQSDVEFTHNNLNKEQHRGLEKSSQLTLASEGTTPDSTLHQRLQEIPKSSPKRASKPKKSSAIPLHLLETNDAVSRGYYSEPETRCSSVLGTTTAYGCEIDASTKAAASAAKPLLAEMNCRKLKKAKVISNEKRSKSETKKPMKESTVLHTSPKPEISYSQSHNQDSRQTSTKMNTSKLLDDKTVTYAIDDTSALSLSSNGNCSKSKSANKSEKTKIKIKKQKQKESKSKSTNVTKTSKTDKAKLKTKSKSNSNSISKKVKSSKTLDADKNAIDTLSIDSGEQDPKAPMENLDQSTTIPRETNNNEIIEKATTIVDIPSQTLAENDDSPLASLIEPIESALPHTLDMVMDTSAIQQVEHFTSLSSLEAATTSQHSDKAQVFLQPALPPRILCHSHHYHGKRTRSRAKFGPRKRQKQKHSTVSYELDERPPPALRGDVVPKWNNGWTWEGEPFQGAVFLNSDDPLVIRTCYGAMRHSEGDIIRTRDCVLLKANEDNELPYVAKVAHLWENPEDGEMMVSLLWYYRPEHTEQGRQPSDSPDEVYASRHRDHNSVACIEDKCYVLTFSEYCRYRRRIRAAEEDIEDVSSVPKPASSFYSTQKVPDNTNPELVMFCRRAYEFRSKRLLKMPNKQDYYVVNA